MLALIVSRPPKAFEQGAFGELTESQAFACTAYGSVAFWLPVIEMLLAAKTSTQARSGVRMPSALAPSGELSVVESMVTFLPQISMQAAYAVASFSCGCRAGSRLQWFATSGS